MPPWLPQEPAQLKLMEAASASALSEDQKRAHEMLKVRSIAYSRRSLDERLYDGCARAPLFDIRPFLSEGTLWLKVLILSERLATQPRARHALGQLFLAVRQSARRLT